MSSSDSVTYGVNQRSTLNDLFGFHVADGQLSQDIMHILLEGVLPYELKLMLNDFINVKQYLDLEFLNDRVFCFTYSPEEAKDKPPPIKVQDLTVGKISMSTPSMLVLLTPCILEVYKVMCIHDCSC